MTSGRAAGKRYGGLALLVAVGCHEAASSVGSAAPAQARVASGALSAPVEAPPQALADPLTLAFIDDFNPPRAEATGNPPAAAWDSALGGLSGLFYSAPEGLLYAVTDDRGRFPPRLYTFSVELGPRSLRVVPRAVVLLHEPVPSDSLLEMDGEGIAGAGESLLLSLEGNAEPPRQRESRILRVTRDGLVTGELAVPLAFHSAPSAEPPRGTRPNLGFEALSVAPSGRFLFASAESALYQDGEPATFVTGARVRMARWDLEHGGEPLELFYRTDPVVPRLDAPSVADTGVSEIVALDDERLLVLERSYVQAGERRVNTIRIFDADLRDVPLGGATPPLVSKRLVLDLADVVPGFDEGRRELDNFEGMTLGPRLPSGNPSLLLVSDDNFSTRQRTVFVALELRSAARRGR